MIRSAVATHLGTWYENYLLKVGRTTADDAQNLGPVIDAAFRGMGVSTENLQTQEVTDDEGLLVQAEYHLMRIIVYDLGKQFDVGIGGGNYALEQVWKHANEALAETRARVLEMFGSTAPMSGDPDELFTTLNLNFLEQGA